MFGKVTQRKAWPSPPGPLSRKQERGSRRRRTFALGFLLFCAIGLPGGDVRGEPDEDPVALFRAGRFDEAREAFQARLSARPGDPEALYYLGRLTEGGAESQRLFEQMLAGHPGHDLADDALFELAEADYAGASGLYVRARRRYGQLLASYPDSPLAPRAFYRIGTTYLVTRQPDSASVAFEEVLRRFPDSEIAPFARLGTVEASAQAGRAAEALEAAEAMLADGPGPLREAVLKQIDGLRAGASGRAQPGKGGGSAPEVRRFWIQVGAFRNRDNLRALSAHLRTGGFQVREEAAGAGGLRLLFAGPYPDRASAGRARKRIEAVAKSRCRVVEGP